MNTKESSGRRFVTRAARAFAVAAAAVLMTVSNASPKSAKPKPEALWVVNDSGNSVTEFASGTLETSGTPTANRINGSADFDEPWGIVFDSSKNLWASNIGNGTVTEFRLAQLKALNMKQAPTAAVVISGLDRPEGLAFDKHHNLWVANEGKGELLEFRSRQLKSSGSPAPNITLSSGDLSSPVGIVFDKQGGIWVSDDDLNHVAMFTAAQLKAGGMQSATVILSDDGSGSLDTPEPIAFDEHGSLWVANNEDPLQDLGSVVEFTSDQLTATGSPTPAVTLTATLVTDTTSDNLQFPRGITFDKQGNLWVANESSDENGSLAEFGPGALGASGSPQPAVFLDSNVGGTNLNAPFMISFGPALP